MLPAKVLNKIVLLAFITALLPACGVIDSVRFAFGGSAPDSPIDPISFTAPESFIIKQGNSNVSHMVLVLKPKKGEVAPRHILLLHEIPGLTLKTLDFGNFLKSKNFMVYIPVLFGETNQNSNFAGAWNYLTNGEWRSPKDITIQYRHLDENQSEEIQGQTVLIHQWLRALVKRIENENSGKSIGVIGMCLTGAVPLALLDNPHIKAVVVAQPTLPLMFWGTEHDKKSLALSKAEKTIAKKRAETKGVKVLGVRFKDDLLSKIEKFDSLKKILGDNFTPLEISTYTYKGDDITGNVFQIPSNAHSTLVGQWVNGHTNHPSNKTREEVVKFFKENLK